MKKSNMKKKRIKKNMGKDLRIKGMKLSTYFVMFNLIFSIIAFSSMVQIVSAEEEEKPPGRFSNAWSGLKSYFGRDTKKNVPSTREEPKFEPVPFGDGLWEIEGVENSKFYSTEQKCRLEIPGLASIGEPNCVRVKLSENLEKYPEGGELRESIENNWKSLTEEDRKHYIKKWFESESIKNELEFGDDAMKHAQIKDGKLLINGKDPKLNELKDKGKITVTTDGFTVKGKEGTAVVKTENLNTNTDLEVTPDQEMVNETGGAGGIDPGTEQGPPGSFSGREEGLLGGLFQGLGNLFKNPLMKLLLIGGGIALLMMTMGKKGDTEVEPTDEGFSAKMKNGGAVAISDAEDRKLKFMAASRDDGTEGKVETIGKNGAVVQNVDVEVPNQMFAKVSNKPTAFLMNGEDGDSPNTFSETASGNTFQLGGGDLSATDSVITASAVLEIPEGQYLLLDKHDASISMEDSSIYSMKGWNVISIRGRNVKFYPDINNLFMFEFNGKKTYVSTTLRNILGVATLENKDEQTLFVLQEFTNRKGLIYSERVFSYTDVVKEHNGILISVLRVEMFS